MDTDNEVQEHENEPDIDELKSDLERIKSNLSYFQDRADTARSIRMSEWPGKGRYGRKEGPDAFPWEGASDLSPQLINGLLDSDVALLKTALKKGTVIAAPVESSDVKSARLVGDFCKWRLNSLTELPREAGVAANNLLQYGSCFLGVYFERRVRRVYQPISIDQIAETAPEFAAAIADPEMKENVMDVARQAFPNISKKRVRKMVSELQKTGQTEIPTEKITMNRPAVRAYALGEDLFVDSNISSMDSARSVYCCHYWTPEQLKEKVLTEGWDSDFVDEVIEKSTGEMESNYQGTFEGLYPANRQAPVNRDGLCKVISVYRKEIDSDGVPLCSVVIFSESCEGYATQYAMSADAGGYPFVAITREHISRNLLQSRGYPEILRDLELAVKVEMDSRVDRASLSTVPPITHGVGRAPPAIGPGAKIPTRRPGEVQYLDIPRYGPASNEVENHLRMIAHKMTGRPTTETDAADAQVLRQELVDNWLNGWTEVLRKIWALDKAYSAEVFFRVTGNPEGQSIIMDDQGEFDFNLSFQATSAEESKVIEKLDTVGRVMATYDRAGQARYPQFLKIFLDALDPNLSAQLIAPAEESNQKEVVETTSDFSKIASGVMISPPQNANAQLRLQILEQIMTGSEEVPAQDLQARLQEDELFAARLEAYTKQLQFIIDQQKNAEIGRQGGPPGLPPTSEQ
ncbi:hypothetical protein OAK38_06195 [Verrucomicrobia bacterium]|nr:hypothetical protein [Verrucomicrobiota bacterium]